MGLFSQARSQMKQEAFSLRFISICSLCEASHFKVLVPITEFQRKPVKRKKNPPCHIELRGHRRISKNCLLGQRFYCFRALLVHDIYAGFFSLRFATAWSLKAKYMAAGGIVWTAGNNRRPHGLSTILKIRCGNRFLHVAAVAAFRRPAGWIFVSAVRQFQVVFFTTCAHHTQRSL